MIKRFLSRSIRPNPDQVKVAVNMKPKNSPWGGINPFVEQLSAYLTSKGHIVTYGLDEDITCILMIKSWPTETTCFTPAEILEFKKKHPGVNCIHRVNECDKRKGTDYVDGWLKKANESADFTVFISDWLKEYFIEKWFDSSCPNAVIRNAADKNIFYPKESNCYKAGNIFRVVTHHWSDNWMKGFNVYKEVDRMISEGSLKGFSLMVIGRWPKEIKWCSAITYPPLRGAKLADLLRQNHAYLTASLWEPCGMHHIEGAQCGLPLVYHEDGGGIVEFGRQYGIGFRDNVREALITARDSYPHLRKQVLEFMPSGIKMCAMYEEVLVSLTRKTKQNAK